MIMPFAIACSMFTLAVMIDLVLMRLRHGQGFLPLGYAVLCFVLIISLPFVLPLGMLSSFCVYLWVVILWNLYLVFFINLMNSVSLRIMLEILRSADRSLTYREIMDIYSDDETFRARVVGLRHGGFITGGGSTMELTSKGVVLARLLALFRSVFGITYYG